MPLLDHFHPTLRAWCTWHSFHHQWAATIASDLNDRLPPMYHARPHVQFGIEIDVATLREEDQVWQDDLARVHALWQPAAPVATIPFRPTTDEVEVLIYDLSGGSSLAAAIELVSPANKDRPESRDTFATKCENYLRDGLGVIVVDVVTERRSDLHTNLLNRLKTDLTAITAEPLSAVAYRPRNDRLDIWREPLKIGGELPVLPLWLKTGPCLPVDLGATYRQTRQGLRIGDEWG